MYSNVISSFQLSACVLQPPHCIYDSKTNLRFIRFAVVILSSPIKFPIQAIFAAKKVRTKLPIIWRWLKIKLKSQMITGFPPLFSLQRERKSKLIRLVQSPFGSYIEAAHRIPYRECRTNVSIAEFVWSNK